MKKRPLSEVLWEAANVHLSAEFHPNYFRQTRWSCLAANLAETGNSNLCGKAYWWLIDQGADLNEINDAPEQDRQGVRYMWLLLAMHVAEDEGITVEVAAQ